MAERESWHLDKRVPISLIFAILVQTGVIVWNTATMRAEQTALVGRMDDLERRADAVTENAKDIAVIKETLRGIEPAIVRIESKVDRLGAQEE